MDIERIQKINNLALDLMRQGLADNRDQAIAQAEKIFRVREGEEKLPSASMSSNSLNVNPDGSAGSDAAEQESAPKESSSLSQDAIKEILEKNTQFLVSKIKEFNEKIAQLEEKVANLKSDLVQARVSARSAPNQQPTPASSAPQPVSAQQSAAPENSSVVKPASTGGPGASNHPRSGEFAEDDVSIEKFFYAGTK